MTIPIESASAMYEDRRSKFHGYASYLEHPDEIKRLVHDRRTGSPGCNHVVWAYVWGSDGEQYGSNDDHEPRGSAGRPALDVLRGSGLTNTIVLIVRYFGGTKLGIGGLVKAYAETTRRVLHDLRREPLVVRVRFRVSLAYRWYKPLQILLAELGALIHHTEFGAEVEVDAAISEDEIESLKTGIGDLTHGTATVELV